jgi:Fic family protein
MNRIMVGAWRDDSTGPMEVVSGPIGKEHVHFEAPEAARLDREMQAFLDWFNARVDMDPVLKAGLAHLWFVTIHPFDDGNGRIARAIADMALARSEDSSQRFYSMSAQIRQERAAYYDILRADRERDYEHHALHGMVPRLFGQSHRRRANHSRPCPRQSTLRGSNRRRLDP